MLEARLVEADRHSAVADALYATTLLSRDEPGRSIAIVFTQGDDSASWLSQADALAAARRSNALVYGVTLHRQIDTEAKGFVFGRDAEGRLRREDLTRLSSVRSGANPSGVLHQVAAATGGRIIYGDYIRAYRGDAVGDPRRVPAALHPGIPADRENPGLARAVRQSGLEAGHRLGAAGVLRVARQCRAEERTCAIIRRPAYSSRGSNKA
jgi:hypothetical protein